MEELLFVTYRSDNVSVERLLEIVKKEGFEAKVVESTEESGG